VAVAGVKHLNDRGARWKLALNFAWKDPRGGDIPELAALQTQICAGSPGWPAFEPIPPIPPPPVTKPSIIALC
jgi:hypothetical protein